LNVEQGPFWTASYTLSLISLSFSASSLSLKTSLSLVQPDNVLVTEFLRAKLSDFGTSRAQGVDSDDVAMTAVGTPLFCAPEILRGEAYDASADVYSFGLLLLAMV